MKWITATFPNLHIHGVAKFEGGVFRSTDPQVLARMAPWVGQYGITQVAEDTDPPDLPLRDPWPGAVLDVELFGSDGKVRESVLPPRLSDVELRAASVAAVQDAIADGDIVAGGGGEVATLAPLYIQTLTTGLVDKSPANLRTGLSSAVHASGGEVEELAITVTGTAGSRVLATAQTAKVAGLGSTPFEAVLNAADGSDDFFVTVVGNNGSTQITLLRPLAANFTGTLSAKYNAALGQHLTAAGTRAYAQHAAKATGLLSSRGRLMAGTFSARPVAYNTAWAKNTALTAYGVQNSVAPIVQTALEPVGLANIGDAVDFLPIRPNAIGSVAVGTHAAGHGAQATLYPSRRDVVVEFWTGIYRDSTNTAASALRVTVSADGAALYDEIHPKAATRVVVPVHGADQVDISVTNNDGAIYHIALAELTMREAGVGGRVSPGRKIVTVGDSWFAWYDGLFATTLAAKTGAKVVNHSLGGMTTEWALAWFDAYVAAERPDEAWFHFFTNDSNDLTGTFTAPDSSSKPLWPTGLTAAQSKARWRDNVRKLIQRCQRLGIKPVIIMPGGTASQGQTQKHAEWSTYLEQPALLDFQATPAELADIAAYVNTVGKATGSAVKVGASQKFATGSSPSASWSNPAEDSLVAVQRAALKLSTYALAIAPIGTDSDADGLSDGYTVAGYPTTTGDTYTPSIVGGNQKLTAAYAASGADGNRRLSWAFTPTVGRDYLAVADIINGPASVSMEAASSITGPGVLINSSNGSVALNGSGAGVVAYRATANASDSKYLAVATPRSNGNTREFTIRRQFTVDLTKLLADAPNLATMTISQLAAFVLALQPS